MKTSVAILSVIALSVLFAGCAAVSARPSAEATATVGVPQPQYRTIAPEEAKKRLDSEPGIILLDVRTAEEYAEGHIAGSVLLPVDNIAAEAEAKLPDKNATVFIYCRSGRRSAIAAEQMIGMGYTDVYDLGGIIDWPYGVEK